MENQGAPKNGAWSGHRNAVFTDPRLNPFISTQLSRDTPRRANSRVERLHRCPRDPRPGRLDSTDIAQPGLCDADDGRQPGHRESEREAKQTRREPIPILVPYAAFTAACVWRRRRCRRKGRPPARLGRSAAKDAPGNVSWPVPHGPRRRSARAWRCSC